MKKLPIPLFYSIIVTSIVLVSMSIINYLLLKTQHNSIQESIISQSQTIASTLQTAVEKKNELVIQEVLTSIGENNLSKVLLDTSIIVYPDGYYHSSTNQELLGKNISPPLANLLNNYQKTNPLQKIQTIEGIQYQSIIPINIFQDKQTWFLRNIFDKSFFDTKFYNFRLLLVFSSIFTALFTFFFTYIFCYFLLSQKLSALNHQIINILKQKTPQKFPSFFKEISQISKNSLAFYKLMKEQKKTILELEEELKNPLKNKIEEKKFLDDNYLCILIKLDYHLLHSKNVNPNLKEFLLEIFNLIIKNTREQKVELVNFGNYFLLILDAKNFFAMGIQSIKNIEKKIHTNAAQFQQFGVKDLTCSIVAHFGKIHSINIKEQGLENNILCGSSSYILHNVIKNAKSKEILITESLIPYLSDKEEHTDINFEVAFFGKKQKVYLLGKKTTREVEKEMPTSIEEDNPLSVNAMLEETLRQ